MGFKIKTLKKDGINTVSRDKKKFLINIKNFPKIYKKNSGIKGFLKSLSNINSAGSLKTTLNLMFEARKQGKPIILFLDQSAILLGLNEIIIEFIQRGWISLIAVNTDFAIYDFEIALSGKTGEDFATNLIKNKEGFGNTEETGIFFNIALKEGIDEDRGGGETIGHYLIENNFEYKKQSVIYNAFKYNVPLTFHKTNAYDVISFHPTFDPQIYGKLLDKDFLILNSFLSKISNGGILFLCTKEYNFLDLIKKSIAFCINKSINMKNYYAVIIGNKDIYSDLKKYLLFGGNKFYLGDVIEIILPLIFSLIIDTGGQK